MSSPPPANRLQIDSDDFALFEFDRCFSIDEAALDRRRRALQSEVHPDRFASQGVAAQRVAMQWAVRVNEAYRRLKDPLQRAAYLCELHGAPIDAESNTAMPGDFLMRQLQWREALDDADGEAAIRSLATEVADERDAAFRVLAQTLDVRHDYPAAAGQVRALMFVERFAADLDQRLQALGQ